MKYVIVTNGPPVCFFGYTLYKFRREISIAEHGCYKFNLYPKEEEGWGRRMRRVDGKNV